VSLKADYQRDGYVFPLPAMSEAEARSYRAKLESAEQQHPGFVQQTSGYVSLAIDFVDELARLDAVLEPVAEILGDDLLVWGTNLFIKNAKSLDFVSWHQDLTYWGLDDADEVTAWIALSPATVASGCMRFIRGTHELPIVEHRDTFEQSNLLSRGQEIVADIDETKAVDVVLSPGEFSLHHGRIFHASHANTSDERRIGLAIRYVSPRMRQAGDTRTMAHLVRGHDEFGHFELAPPPVGVMAPVDVERVSKAHSLQQGYTYAGAEEAGKRVLMQGPGSN